MMAQSKRKLVIGLAGGVGSGKSTVARLLREQGAAVIDSDRLNRDELSTPAVIDTLVAWFGDRIRDPEGSIHREALANIVFNDPKARARVEGLLHPRIARRRQVLIEQANNDPSVRAVAIDSPLLFEAGLNAICHVVLFVDAPRWRREQRVMAQRSWPRGELARREKLQKPLDSKKAAADHIVVNNSGLEGLRRRVERLLSELLNEAST